MAPACILVAESTAVQAEVKITFADGSKMHKLIHLFATIVPGQSKFELNRYKLQLIMKVENSCNR